MESPWNWGTKVCSKGPGHMTKMAALPIYGKNIKNLLLRNQKADELGMQHRVLEYCQVCSNDDPGLSLSYFTTRSNLLFYGITPYAFSWENGKAMNFSETIVAYDLKLATDDRSDKKFLLTSNFVPSGLYSPAPELYTCIKSWKQKCIKSDFKEISLKLATNG